MDVEYHATGSVVNGGIGVGCSIVEQADNGLCSVVGDLGLCSGDGAKGNQHGGVDGNAVVQQHANDSLDVGDLG